MGVEIERKFLVRNDAWRDSVTSSARIAQGYLVNEKARVVRVRVYGERGFLTIKGAQSGLTRVEFEYEIPKADAEQLLVQFCGTSVIDKTRSIVTFAGHEWEVDEFRGENAGLLVAELELATEDTPFDRPTWVGDDVTADARYLNANLVKLPYSKW